MGGFVREKRLLWGWGACARLREQYAASWNVVCYALRWIR